MNASAGHPNTDVPGEPPREAAFRLPIEPFVYFREHASAIPGLGGKSRSPNPNYCFHTHYLEYAPGLVLFHVRILDARATFGELEIRVHGYRPDNPDLGIKLVAGTRVSLAEICEDVFETSVRIAAVPGVHYAVFGTYSEFGDLRASDVELEAEQFGGESAEDYGAVDTPSTNLQPPRAETVSALVASSSPSLHTPGSQACTLNQLASETFALGWPELPAPTDNASAETRWRQVYALQVLQQFGFLSAGSSGLGLGEMPETFERVLHDRGCLMAFRTPAEVANPELSLKSGHYDFLVALDAGTHCVRFGGLDGFVTTALRRLLRGGMAIFVFDFTDQPIAVGDHEHPIATRAEIEQLTLRLIGHGCTVAQLAFPTAGGKDRASSATPPFGLTVRR